MKRQHPSVENRCPEKQRRQFVVVTSPGYMVVSDIDPGYVEDRLVITEAYTKCYTPESRWYL